MLVRVLIVDDEPHARRGLSRLVSVVPGFSVVREVSDGATALEVLELGGIDLVLLDVQMPGMSGLDVVSALGPERMPAVIFVTAYDRFAVRAFDLAAVDYLLKPFKEGRLRQALERARASLDSEDHRGMLRQLVDTLRSRPLPTASPQISPASRTQIAPARFVVIGRGIRTIVSSNDVEWISGAGYYSRLHVGGKVMLIRESLNSIEKRLPAREFVRVHRSAIVRRDAIREVKWTESGSALVVLAGSARVRLSRTHRSVVAQLLKEMRGTTGESTARPR